MQISDLRQPLTEGSTTPIIIVDVQPAYANAIDFNVSELANLMNWHRGKILMFANAEVEGLTQDTQDDIYFWWTEQGMDSDVWERPNFTYFDKGYGYLRSWMDEEISPAAIIRTIRYMFQKREHDSREIPPEELAQVVGEDEWQDWMVDDPLITNWVGIDLLHQHRGFICGGGRNECLREVTLMMNAFNLKYKLMSRFIYG